MKQSKNLVTPPIRLNIPSHRIAYYYLYLLTVSEKIWPLKNPALS